MATTRSDPFNDHATKKVWKFGARATPHEAMAVAMALPSNTLRCPLRSPNRASTGTIRAETTNWAASNQFAPAVEIERCWVI